MEWEEVETIYEERQFQWKLPNFFYKCMEMPICASQILDLNDSSWNLCLIRRYFKPVNFHQQVRLFSDFHFEVHLSLLKNLYERYCVTCTVGLRRYNGSTHFLKRNRYIFKKTKHLYTGLQTVVIGHIFVKHVYENRRKLAPNGDLTVVFTIKKKFSIPPNVPVGKVFEIIDLSKDFKEYFTKQKDADVKLIVQNKVFKAHKSILRARSSFFDSMFQHNMEENKTGVVRISDCDPDSFMLFLEYLYCGDIAHLTFMDIVCLYGIAHKYCAETLMKYCVNFMSQHLSTDNVLKVATLANLYQEEKLFSAVQIFIRQNRNIILSSSQWENLEKTDFSLANKLLV